MAFSLNKCELIGNLARDPEQKATKNGNYITHFTVVTSRDWKTEDGEKHSQAEFHNVVVLGKFGEAVMQFLHKGDKVYVEGTMQTSTWETQDGVKKSRMEIISKNLIFLSTKPVASTNQLDQNISSEEF